MGLSVNEFTYSGADEFNLNFAMGYASRGDVTAYKDGEFPVDLEFDWLTDSRVRLADGHDLSNGDTVVFRRTVSKTELPVDLTQPGALTRESVETAVMHSMYAYHELLDGRFHDLLEISDAVYSITELSVATALQNFLFSAEFKQDLVIQGQLDSPSAVYWNTGGFQVDTADVYFEVINPPSETVELLIYHNGAVIYAVTVEPSGEYTVNTTTIVETVSGPFTQGAVNSYSTGLQYVCVLPATHSAVVDFDTELSDYVSIFEGAMNS